MPQGLLISALDVSSKVNQFGAYAGLAAIVGLGVLSLLYFAQARELKRLRDWAGRAPERAAETQAVPVAQAPAGQRLAPHPQAQRTNVSPAQPTQAAAPARPSPTAPSSAAAAAAAASAAASRPGAPPTPGAAPAAASAAAAGSAPVSASRPAAPSPAAGTPAAGTPGASPTTPAAAAPGTSPAAPAAPARPAAALSQPTVASRPVTPQSGTPTPSPGPATVPRAAGRPTTPLRAPGQGGGGQGAYQPASARARSDAQRELGVEGGSPLRTTLIVVGGVVLVAVIVFVLVTQVFGAKDDTPAPNTIQTTASTTTTAKTTTTKKPKAGTPTVVRGDTTVTVLNGTQTGGLAMTETNKLQQLGFKTGTPADAVDQSATTSTVYFADGQRPAADEVAGALGLSADSVRALDASTKVLAPGADVVVVVGADQAG